MAAASVGLVRAQGGPQGSGRCERGFSSLGWDIRDVDLAPEAGYLTLFLTTFDSRGTDMSTAPEAGQLALFGQISDLL